MSIRRWSDFDKNKKVDESLKKFTKGNTSKEVDSSETPQRGHVSASSEYEDDITQNIIKQKQVISSKQKERQYKTKRVQNVIQDDSLYPPKTKDRGLDTMNENDKQVDVFGKIAKFPSNTKASKAFNWMHNLRDPKLSKKDIWYLMVEKQDNELQMIKYQQKQGVNLTKFIMDLKDYYIEKYKDNKKLIENISKIELGGDAEGNISSIRNIPNVKIEGGKKLIHKITEDLVKLLG